MEEDYFEGDVASRTKLSFDQMAAPVPEIIIYIKLNFIRVIKQRRMEERHERWKI
jgi:hypothetical protein